ncbi:hypothetical protein [Endothiovibrio diazotrophicus]
MNSGNTIRVRVEFSYRGEHYAPAAVIDLDGAMGGAGGIGDLHPMLARLNGIDTYSYLYEVMESHELLFDRPTGLAVASFHDGVFDLRDFERRWRDARRLSLLGPVARRHLGVDDLGEQPALREALLEAFRLGEGGRE